MDFLKEQAKLCRERFESMCKQQVLDVVDRGELITNEEYEQLCDETGGFNSYDRCLLYPLMNDALLIKTTKYCLLNCSPDKRVPATTYNGAVLNIMAPLLIKRLEGKQRCISDLLDACKAVSELLEAVKGTDGTPNATMALKHLKKGRVEAVIAMLEEMVEINDKAIAKAEAV